MKSKKTSINELTRVPKYDNLRNRFLYKYPKLIRQKYYFMLQKIPFLVENKKL